MQDYCVEGKVTLHVYVDVTASSPEEAIKQAFRLIQKLKHTKRKRLIPLIKKTYEL